MTAATAQRAFAWFAGALALVLAPDCDGGGGARVSSPPEGGDAGIAAAGVRLASTTWRLTWNTDGVTRVPGGGIIVTNDRGYRVQVQSGRLTNHSVSLGRCVTDSPAPDLGAWRLPFRLGVRRAEAHEDLDASAIELALEEDLADPADQGDFKILFPAARYCRAHWLIAIPGSGPGGLGPEVTQISIQIKGTWSRAGQSGEFNVRTWWPEGRVVDIAAAAAADPMALWAAQSDGQPHNARVTVERRLGALFDSIDFAADSNDRIAGQLLANLAGSSAIRVDLDR